METIKTTLHYYRFDLTDEAQETEYRAMCDKLTAMGLNKFASIAHNHSQYYRDTIRPLDGSEITLELEHVFDNQWNTGPTQTNKKGLRVFDWAEPIYENRDIREGEWLEQTAEMREVRDNTNACGFCGYQARAQRGDVFCPRCIDSEYLKVSDLHLTRMQAVSAGHKRTPLSEAERAHLLPLYREAQIHGSTDRGKKRAAERRRKVIAEYAEKIANAETKRDGFLWLLDHGINTGNVIFYDHTGRFCFGWRQPVDDELRGQLLDVISEFQWPYEIRCANGDNLQGNIG